MTSPDDNTNTTIGYTPHPDIHVRSLLVKDGTMTVALEGQIRHYSATSLQEFLHEQLAAQKPKSLILDFREIKFVDSQGLAFLIALYKFCYAQACTLSIASAPAPVLNLIKLTRIDSFITIILE